jgi:hypothetical protein
VPFFGTGLARGVKAPGAADHTFIYLFHADAAFGHLSNLQQAFELVPQLSTRIEVALATESSVPLAVFGPTRQHDVVEARTVSVVDTVVDVVLVAHAQEVFERLLS